jgi:hypothetical protein
MNNKYIKEIGITISYLWLLLATFLFDWKPFAIFISFLLEFITLILIYLVVRAIDQFRNPRKYRKLSSSGTLAFAVIPLVAIQYLFISLVVSILDPTFDFFDLTNLWDEKWLSLSFLIIIVLYILKTLQFKDIGEAEKVLQETFFLEALSLNFSNLIGVAIVAYGQVNSLPIVLCAMVLFRIFMEIKFSKHIQLF